MKKFKQAKSESHHESPSPVVVAPSSSPSIFLVSRSRQAPKVSDEWIASAEASLGVRLPQSYKDLLHQQNGGFLKLCTHPSGPNLWASNHVPVESLPGVWPPNSGDMEFPELRSFQSARESRHIPSHLILLSGDEEGRLYVCLQYDSNNTNAEPVVVLWQSEAPLMTLAPNFAEFLKGLREEPEDAPPAPGPAPVPAIGSTVPEEGEEVYEDEYDAWGTAALLGPDLDEDDEGDEEFVAGPEEEDEEFIDEEELPEEDDEGRAREEEDGDGDAGGEEQLLQPPGKRRRPENL